MTRLDTENRMAHSANLNLVLETPERRDRKRASLRLQ